MSQVLTKESSDARSLDSTSSQRVLSDAIAARARVRLLISTGGIETPVGGRIVEGDTSSLLLQVDELDSVAELLLPMSFLHVTIETADVPYVFESSLLGAAKEPQPGSLRIKRPRSVFALERRRSGRTPLQEPALVTLHALDGAHTWQCVGDMLNLSPDGVACRVPAPDAARLMRARKVRAAFRVGTHPQAFEFTCRISNVTRGATPQTVVLGIAFVAQDHLSGTQANPRPILADAIAASRGL